MYNFYWLAFVVRRKTCLFMLHVKWLLLKTNSQVSWQVHDIHKKLHFKTFKLIFHWPIGCCDNEWPGTHFALTWVGWPNGETVASNYVQIWSRPNWEQVNGRARKAWPNGVESRCTFSTCVNKEFIWPGLELCEFSSRLFSLFIVIMLGAS